MKSNTKSQQVGDKGTRTKLNGENLNDDKKITDLDAERPILDGQYVLKEDGGPYPYDRETYLELKAWCDREPGVDTETWFRNLLAAKRNVVRPFTDPFKKAYDEAALESARRQMNLNEELQQAGTSSGWHLDLTSSTLELDGVSFPGAVLLGTNTLGEFLWADENHPSSGNLSKESMAAVRELRKRFSNIPEFVSSGIMVQNVISDPVIVGFLVSAISSVSMGETWAYYRGPKSETSWLWIAFDASPLGGLFTPENKAKSLNEKIMFTSMLAMELRKNSVQLALSPIPPFDFRRATFRFCESRLQQAEIDDDGIIQEKDISEDEARRILHDKQQAVAESSSEDDGAASSFNYTSVNQSSINNSTFNTTRGGEDEDDDSNMDVRYVQDGSLHEHDIKGWKRFDLLGLEYAKKKNKQGKQQRKRLASLIFDGHGRVHQVAALDQDHDESDSEADDNPNYQEQDFLKSANDVQDNVSHGNKREQSINSANREQDNGTYNSSSMTSNEQRNFNDSSFTSNSRNQDTNESATDNIDSESCLEMCPCVIM